jgi:heme exporter protein A
MRLVVDQIAGMRGGNILFSQLSFVLEQGQGLIVTGANGSGKSTLLRVLAGLMRPSQGTVRYEDEQGHTPMACHYLGALNAMKDQLTVRENLAFWAAHLALEERSETAQKPPREDTPRAQNPLEAALEAVRLPHVIDTPFGYLSTGQKRRVAIARLVAVHRPVWLVDEPTSGLDRASESLFADIAKNYLASGGIMVAATHLPLGIDGLQHLHIGGEA